MIKELFKDSAKYFPSIAVPAIIGIVTIPIVTRLFPAEDYGNYVLVMTTTSLLSAIATAWIGSSTLRFFPVYKSSGELDIFYSVVLKLCFLSIAIVTFTFTGALFLTQGHISASLHSLMQVGLLVFIATSYSSIFLDILRAKRQVVWYSSFMVWRSVVGLGLGIALVRVFRFGVSGLLWGSLISTIVILPLLWKISLYKPSLKGKEGGISSSISWEMAKYGIPAMAINIFSWAQSLSDRYILGFFRGSGEVGIYSASYALSERGIFFITSLFLLSSSPIGFSIWENQGVRASQEFMRKLTRYYLLIGLPATVGLSILAKPIMGILVAPEYLQGYRIVPLVAFGAFLVGVAHRFTVGLSYHKRTNLLMFCYLGSVALNVVLNLLFIPKYGYMAAATTTFAAYAFLLLSTIFVSRRFFAWGFPFSSLIKVACASAIMGAAIYLVSNNLTSSTLVSLILGAPLGVVVYLIVLFMLGEIQSNEKQVMKKILAKLLPGKLIPGNWR